MKEDEEREDLRKVREHVKRNRKGEESLEGRIKSEKQI